MSETKSHIDRFHYEFRSADAENVAILNLIDDKNNLKRGRTWRLSSKQRAAPSF